jgi:hypothetical protein
LRDGWIVALAGIIGIATGLVWSRWRHNVVAELRAIRRLLEHEQESVLRAIRDLLRREHEQGSSE